MAVTPGEAGWYPDQADPESLRYWNGRAWTARRKPRAPQAEASARPERPASARRERPVPAERKRRPVWPWVIGALLLARTAAGLVSALNPPDPSATTAVHHPSAPAATQSAPTH